MAALPDQRIAEEQAALVARAVPSEAVCTAITEEVGRLMRVDYVTMARFGPDDTVSLVAASSSSGAR